MSAPYAIPNPPRGQAFDKSFAIISSTTGNPISGGLTSLGAKISKDNGAFVATTNVPVELFDTDGTTKTGFGYVLLTAEEMDANKIVLQVFSASTGAVTFKHEIVTQDLRPGTARYDDETVVRPERIPLDNHDFLHNRQFNSGAEQVIYNADGFEKLRGAIVDGDVMSERSRLT